MFVNGCFVKFIYWFLLVESEQNFQTLKIFSFITFGGYQILKCYNFYNFWLRYVQKRKKCCSLVKPAVINIFYNRKYQNFITWLVFASHRTFVDIFGNCKLIWIYHRQVQTKITAFEDGIGQNSLRNWLGVGLKKKRPAHTYTLNRQRDITWYWYKNVPFSQKKIWKWLFAV